MDGQKKRYKQRMIKDIYIALTLLKAIIIIVGMGFIILNLIFGFRDKDDQKFKKAGLIFLGICGSLTILTIIEFSIALNR